MLSVVRAGINGFSGYKEYYDIKDDSCKIVTKRYDTAYWGNTIGWKANRFTNGSFLFTYNSGENARYFLDLFGDNNIVTVRLGENTVSKFQTAGFWDFVESKGITKEEIYAAIANEEF